MNKQIVFGACICALACLLPQTCHAVIRYVRAGANASGISWGSPSGDLQAMIDASSEGDQVWVAAGTYKPTNGTNRGISFSMKNGVAIYGGFPSTGNPGFGDRNWVAYPTILSGDIGTPNVDTDNSHRIFNNSGLNSSALLDGFTLTKAYGSSSGGGMFNLNGSPTLKNCVFLDNYSLAGGGLNNYSGSPELINCSFINNSTNNSGGGIVTVEGVMTLTDCIFLNNTGSGGGGVFIFSGSATFSNCTFTGNGASNGGGGGILVLEEASVSLTNCIFSDNSSPLGGGIQNRGNDATIINCTFFDNTNTALSSWDISIVTNCIFWGNSNPIVGADVIVSYSIVQGGHAGPGNKNENPLFVDPANGDFHLQICSPAINAATSSGAPTDDFDGNARPVHGSYDMGAFEYLGNYPPPTLVAHCRNRTVHLNADGEATPPAADLDNGSTGCGSLEFEVNGESDLYFDCENLGSHTVTLTVTDESGTTATCTATISVEDNIAPTINCPDDITVTCLSQAVVDLDAVSASDNCGTPVKLNCAGSAGLQTCTNRQNVLYTYCVTDASGNSASCTQRITVYDDVKPNFTNVPADVTVQCKNTPAVGTPTATDGCGGPVPIEYDGQTITTGACLDSYTITRQWTATDACGNTKTATQIITVQDTQKPVFTSVPANLSVQCNSVPTVGSATATDNCDHSVTITYNGQTTTPGACPDSYSITRQWTAADNCGNTQTAIQTITVQDTQKPNFTAVPANVTVQCNSVPAVGSASATDNCDATVTVTYNGQTTAAGACSDSYTITRQWTATDNCGNTKTATQRISIIDTQKPNFTSTPVNITVQCDAVPAPSTPAATDNCDAAVAITYNGQTQTNGACPNAYTLTRTWTAADNCGNTKTVTQRITVVDNGKPVFTSFPENTTIACHEYPPAVGTPTASDGCGTATVTYLGQSTTNGSCPGDYQIKRTWRATDACGNSTVATQTIQVTDNGAPVFVTVPADATIQCGQPLPPIVNPTASDACGGYVSITFLGNVPSGSGCAADYTVTRTWRAQDLCGNTATATQVITVQGNNYGEQGAEDRADATRLTTASRLTSMTLQPNPTTDRIWLDLTDFAGEAMSVSIFGEMGQLVWERRIPLAEQVKIDISLREAGAAPGLYIVRTSSIGWAKVGKVLLVE